MWITWLYLCFILIDCGILLHLCLITAGLQLTLIMMLAFSQSHHFVYPLPFSLFPWISTSNVIECWIRIYFLFQCGTLTETYVLSLSECEKLQILYPINNNECYSSGWIKIVNMNYTINSDCISTSIIYASLWINNRITKRT